MTSGRSKNFILTGQIVEEREVSWKVLADNGETYWLAKSQCESYDKGTRFSIPMWLAEKMELT